ncbi:MAG TPA: glycerol-3-phosphate acyltransferase [Acidimicrobiia bacterium]|nr:glycerol-3-phosphate acyltransferase [Acidimicrobiia bacterium]
MTALAAALLGYLIGSLPTANGLARLWGVDLRTSGSGNPGANNARRVGGLTLFLVVLVVEAGKGLLAVTVGLTLGGDLGAVSAGVGAAAGNVHNVWYSFRGGKGLGITLGVLLAAWPTVIPVVLVILAIAAAATRSSGIGALVTLACLFVAALTWEWTGLGTGWGVEDVTTLAVLGVGIPLVLWRRHWADAVARLKARAHL